jgi:hypothetical protein
MIDGRRVLRVLDLRLAELGQGVLAERSAVPFDLHEI